VPPGQANTDVAREVRVAQQTVCKWRQHFVRGRLDGLLDEPRPSAPRTVTDAAVERSVTQTLETTPAYATQWSTRAMAERSEPEYRTSHLAGRWPAAASDRDVQTVGRPAVCREGPRYCGALLPPSPGDKALVLCVDENAQIQAMDRTSPLLPMRPGQIERRTHDYRRHGTTSLFAALEVRTGRVIGELHQRHRAAEFRQFMDTVEASVPPRLDVHLILDNYGTHTTAVIRRWLLKRPRFHLRFTPTGTSWLNLVERWFALLTERRLRRGVHPGVRALKATIRQYITVTNTHPTPFTWTKTADEILASVARLCQRTSETGH